MRSLLLAPCLFLAIFSSAPALAGEPEKGPAELAEKLNDPLTQYAVAGMLSAMSKSLLEMRVEPLVKAMDGIGGKGMHRLPPDATVADVIGTDHAAVRDGLVKNVPKALGAMGAMASAAEKMIPELEKMGREVRDAAPEL